MNSPVEEPDNSNEPTSETLGDLSLTSANLVGAMVDDYQVLRRLGRGGMADVYVARSQSLDRQVALKVLKRQLAGDADYVERFRREARAAAKLSHPNIVQVYSVGRDQDHHYIAQELIDGGNLKDEVEKSGPLRPDAAIQVLKAVALALEAAHQAGITHRDIKPENILRSQRGEIKVADFGLARVGQANDLTRVGLTMGTPRYMSPEQVQGKVADPRSDLYSLGCSMYFLLTGRPPFEADDALAIAFQHMHDSPTPLDKARGKNDVPLWLVSLIAKLMAKSPSDRYADATQLIAALEDSGVGVTQAGSSTIHATTLLQQAMRAEASRRRRRRVRITLAVLFPLVACSLGFFWQSRRKGPTVKRLLAPEVVPRKPTVEEQYLAAASRDDVAAWLAVSEYFPAEGESKSKNFTYATKANLQLARLYAKSNRLSDAEQLLNGIVANPAAERVYKLVALSELIAMAEQAGRNDTALWRSLRENYVWLKDNRPGVDRALPYLIKEEILIKLQSS